MGSEMCIRDRCPEGAQVIPQGEGGIRECAGVRSVGIEAWHGGIPILPTVVRGGVESAIPIGGPEGRTAAVGAMRCIPRVRK